MSNENDKWLDVANRKYESCAHAVIRNTHCQCGLGGYPVLDCPGCRSYKEKEAKDGE